MNFINFNYRRDASNKVNTDIAIEVLENHNITLNKDEFLNEQLITKSAASKISKSGEMEIIKINNIGSKNKKFSLNKPNGIIFLDNHNKTVIDAYKSTPLTKNSNGKHFQTRNITITPRTREFKATTLENEGNHISKNTKDILYTKPKISKNSSSKNNIVFKGQTNNKLGNKSKKNKNLEINPSDLSTPIQKNKVSLNLKNLNIISKSNRTVAQINSSSSNIISFDLYKQNKKYKNLKDSELSKSNSKAANLNHVSLDEFRLFQNKLSNINNKNNKFNISKSPPSTINNEKEINSKNIRKKILSMNNGNSIICSSKNVFINSTENLETLFKCESNKNKMKQINSRNFAKNESNSKYNLINTNLKHLSINSKENVKITPASTKSKPNFKF